MTQIPKRRVASKATARRALLVSELPEGFVEAIACTRMDARHDHLDGLLKKRAGPGSMRAKRG